MHGASGGQMQADVTALPALTGAFAVTLAFGLVEMERIDFLAACAFHFVPAEAAIADEGLALFSPSDCLFHLLFALEFNHFSVSGFEVVGCSTDERILSDWLNKGKGILPID